MKLKALALLLLLTSCTINVPGEDDGEAKIKIREPSLAEIQEILKTKEFVDLTHSFAPGIPHHPLLPDEERETLATVEEVGFFLEKFSHVGQWGTHVDPPIHFIEGGRSADEITLKEMILPLVVIDVHEKATANPDYTITMQDVRDWESQHGAVPAGSFVAMRTDWSSRWPDGEAMQNMDEEEVKHYPGWSQEVLTYLIEEQNVAAIGHETTDTDPGIATTVDDYALEYYVLEQDRYQIEMLANLDQVPEAGALILATWPKPEGGSGFPARVFAILP
jgi:kynurenine formamidase